MLRSVKARSEDSQTQYECPQVGHGFRCGRCGLLYPSGLLQPTICRQCGAQFTYCWESPDALTLSLPEFRNRQATRLAELMHWQSWEEMSQTEIDRGPTTACFDCGTIIPIGDCFYSSTVDQRALCEGCYGTAEKAGRARTR